MLRDIGFGIGQQPVRADHDPRADGLHAGQRPAMARRVLQPQPPERRDRVRRILDRMASAVSAYVVGALTVSLIDGLAAFVC